VGSIPTLGLRNSSLKLNSYIMKTKERLERAGWKFLVSFSFNTELYTRKNLRILYDVNKDEVISYYDTTSNEPHRSKMVSAYRLDIFCKKLNSG